MLERVVIRVLEGKSMLQRSWSWHIGVALVIVLASAFVRAEDAPKPEVEQKAPPAATDTKEAAPAPAAAAATASEKPGADPLKIEGTPPTFPIKSERYNQIDDSYENIASNMNDNQMDIEYGPMEEMLVALRASTQD